MHKDPLDITATLTTESGSARYTSLRKLAEKMSVDTARLAHTVIRNDIDGYIHSQVRYLAVEAHDIGTLPDAAE